MTEEIVAAIVHDHTHGAGVWTLHKEVFKGPCLLTPRGAVFFMCCLDMPTTAPRRLTRKDFLPGVDVTLLSGKRARALFHWAQQFGNNISN